MSFFENEKSNSWSESFTQAINIDARQDSWSGNESPHGASNYPLDRDSGDPLI